MCFPFPTCVWISQVELLLRYSLPYVFFFASWFFVSIFYQLQYVIIGPSHMQKILHFEIAMRTKTVEWLNAHTHVNQAIISMMRLPVTHTHVTPHQDGMKNTLWNVLVSLEHVDSPHSLSGPVCPSEILSSISILTQSSKSQYGEEFHTISSHCCICLKYIAPGPGVILHPSRPFITKWPIPTEEILKYLFPVEPIKLITLRYCESSSIQVSSRGFTRNQIVAMAITIIKEWFISKKTM